MSNWFSSLTSKFTKIPNQEVCWNGDLTPNEKAVLLALGGYNPIRPSDAQLAKNAGMSLNTLKETKKLLKQQNVVSWITTKGKGCTYTILPSPQWSLLSRAQKNGKVGKKMSSKATTSATTQTANSTNPSPHTGSLIRLPRNTKSISRYNNTNKDQSTQCTDKPEPLTEDSGEKLLPIESLVKTLPQEKLIKKVYQYLIDDVCPDD